MYLTALTVSKIYILDMSILLVVLRYVPYRVLPQPQIWIETFLFRNGSISRINVTISYVLLNPPDDVPSTMLYLRLSSYGPPLPPNLLDRLYDVEILILIRDVLWSLFTNMYTRKWILVTVSVLLFFL